MARQKSAQSEVEVWRGLLTPCHPNASPVWKTECRNQTCQRLGDVLTEAAREERSKRMTGTTHKIKLEFAFNFFQQLSPQQQDEICGLAKAARTGVPDQLAQRYLNELKFTTQGKSWRNRSNYRACRGGGIYRCSTEWLFRLQVPQQAKATFSFTNWATILRLELVLVGLRKPWRSCKPCRSILRRPLVKTQPRNPVGARLAKNICQCLGAYRMEVAQSQGNVSLLDKHLASTKLHRKQWQQLGVNVSRLKWQQAQAASSGRSGSRSPWATKQSEGSTLDSEGDSHCGSELSRKFCLVGGLRQKRQNVDKLHLLHVDIVATQRSSPGSSFVSYLLGHCGFAKPASRMTDYCDHCWFLQSSIEPGLKKFMKEAQSQITNLFPSYFENWSPNSKDNTLQVAQAFLQFLDSGRGATKKQRRTLGVALQLSLHELEAKITPHLRWEVTVADAYFWRKESADRQTAAVSLFYIGDYTFLVLGKDSLSVGKLD